MHDLLRNVISGTGLLFLRRRADGDFRVSPEALAALALLDLLLSAAVGYLLFGLEGQFDYLELPRALFYLPLTLWVAWLAARNAGCPERTLLLAVALASIGIPMEVVEGLIRLDEARRPFGPEVTYWISYALFGWWALAAGLALLRLAPAAPVRALRNLAAFVVFLVVPLWLVPQGELWAPAPTAAAGTGIASEEALYAQPALLERELEALEPGRPGVEDLYFVGFAGYADEDVFMKEVDVISRLFDERFGTAGRSLVLVNNPRTVLSRPMATATSLAAALQHLGSIMDEEDVLFLYLTSHGSENHRLAVQFAPLQLNDLDPPGLRALLDASGIRWRVVVISACYSGGFIDALKDGHTLVITAADARHTSFGCGAASDFTYFGKAYFDEELRRTRSFLDAFERARLTIAKRERAAGEEASNPQMYVGAAMRRKLEQLQQRFGR